MVEVAREMASATHHECWPGREVPKVENSSQRDDLLEEEVSAVRKVASASRNLSEGEMPVLY